MYINDDNYNTILYNSINNNVLLVHMYIKQGSAQDYLEVVKMESDRHVYNIFQSNDQ